MRICRVAACVATAYLIYGALALAQVQVNEQQSPQVASGVTVPRLVRIKGTVVDETGKPRSANIGITFTLYKDQDGQFVVWQETQTVQLDSAGHYSVLLGATNEAGLPQEIFSTGEARWLGIRPDGQAEQPRTLLLSVPYAMKAGDSEMLGGRPASAFVLADSQYSLAQPAYGTSTASANSQVGSQIATPGSGAVLNSSPQAACSSITSDGTATANQITKFTSACNIENSAIFESGGNVGIGNTSPAGKLDVSGSAFIRGSLSALGGAIFPPAGTATPSGGFVSFPLDLEASSYNTGSSGPVSYIFRWQADPVGNDTSTTGATLNLLYGISGNVSQTGLSVAQNGILTFAPGQTFPGAGGGGTVTSVGTGAGLTGGPITNSGTISIPSAGVTNAMLANSTIKVVAGTGMSGGGTVALGGTVTLTNAAPGLGGTVTSVGSGTGLSGGPITGSGTLSLDTSFTDARYLQLTGGTLTGGLNGTTAAFTGGLAGSTGTFSGTVSAAGALMPQTGTATAAKGFTSNPFDLQASSFSSATSKAIAQDFRWQAEPTGNNTSSPSGSLNLLFGSNGSSPTETGLSIASNGLVTFASGQTFPGGGGGTVTSVGTGAGLTGGPITGSGTISIPPAGVTNSMLANSSITVQAGSGLSGGGTVALGGTVTLAGNFAGTADGIAYFSSPTSLTSTPAPTNGQILIGSTGNAPVLGTLTAGQNISITNSPGSVTISAAGGGGATLPFFISGGQRTGASQPAALNITKLWGFLLPYSVTTTKITYDVTTADNTANNYDIGIYNSSGNLVVDIGPTPGTTFAPSKLFRTLSWTQGSTAFAAGRYYIGLTMNCSASCAQIAAVGSYVSFAINASAGASTGGALPSTVTPPADNWAQGNQPTVVIQ